MDASLHAPIPMICSACRATPDADDPAVAELAELLAFEPVPVRAHSNNWTPAHQRGFIAALAITGSLGKAARAVGRYPFGAERLRKARGGASFAMAWDAALDHCRRHELSVMGADLKALREEEEADRLRPRSVFRRGRADRTSLRARRGGDDDYDDETAAEEDYEEAMERISSRLRRARQLFLLTIEGDAEKRRAWELLVGPVDWDGVADHDGPHPGDRGGTPDMASASMVVPAQAGMLPELTGEEAHPAIRFFQAIGKAADDLTEEEREAIAAHIDELKALGWVQQDDGSWTKPADSDPPPPKPKRKPGRRAPKPRAVE